jgi:outer membrane protein
MRWLQVIIVLASVAGMAGQGGAGEKPLSLHECEEIALKNQPSITVAQQNVAAGQGREMQARSPYFPQLAASTGYSESWNAGGAFGAGTTKTYSTTLQLNQTLYDFGRTGNALDAARWGTRSSQQDKERTVHDVILNVKQAYYALLASKILVDVTQKQVSQTESHLAQAQAFFNAGSKPKYDVTRAEVEVNNARLSLISANNDVRVRTIALNNAMGIDPGKPTEIENKLPPVPDVPELAKAQEESLKNRPELMKADADIEAAKARVRAEKANYYPSLSVNGAYNWASGTQDLGNLPTSISGISGRQLVGDIGDSWNAGILLSLPLFQGGVTKGRVNEARANLIALEAQRSAVVQTVLLEVNQSYADLESSKARIDAMESALQKARESLELAQGRYEAGIGPTIEVTDAQLASLQAERDHIQALYDYRLAIARLFRAMGRTAIE